MEGIHDRMPVILDPATFDVWLDPANEDIEELRGAAAATAGGHGGAPPRGVAHR